MKSLLKIAGVCALLPLITAGARLPDTDVTVHEWGTFTSVAGEDGSAVDWNTLGCKDDLPRFVNDYGYRNFKFSLNGTVRMETPVLYFYSAKELVENVKVSFPGGLITEWYPHAEYKVLQNAKPLPANLNGINTGLTGQTGTIEWKNIKVEPGAAPALPNESAPSRYYAARATDAAPLTIGEEHEKFLFYRGVGRFPIPLSARVMDNGKVAVENRGDTPAPIVILFENREGDIGYRSLGTVAGRVTADAPALGGSSAQLRSDLESALIAQGLYPKEAAAMIDTWRDSWFEEGSRLIYILPETAVNAVLPLDIEPAPARTTRVFVGRIELITPRTKQAVREAIAKGDTHVLEQYRRFLDPISKSIGKRANVACPQ